MTLFLFSAIPALILSFIFSRKFEISTNILKPGMLFIVFGVLSGIVVSILYTVFPSLDKVPDGVIDTLTYVMFKVGLIEESGKFLLFQLGLFFIISDELKTRNITILFSTMTGLGFALIENFSYATHYGIGVLISRTLIAMPMHMCCGFLIGWVLTSSIKYRTIVAIGLATLLHGIYDFWAFSGYKLGAILTFVISVQFMFIEINKLKAND